MCCLVRFFNAADFPVISVIVDDMPVFSDILSDTFSPYTRLDLGRRCVTVLQNNNRVYLTGDISLSSPCPHTVIVTDCELIIIRERMRRVNHH